MKWSEIEVWLDGLSYLSGDESTKGAVLNNINEKRDLYDLHDDNTPLCRHCLIRMTILATTSSRAEKKLKRILKSYDFDNAIIC